MVRSALLVKWQWSLAAVVLAVAACAGPAAPDRSASSRADATSVPPVTGPAVDGTTSTTVDVPVPMTTLPVPEPPTASSAPAPSTAAPPVIDEVEQLAIELADHERIARDAASDELAVSEAARSAQVIYRRVARTPGWPERFLEALPPSLTSSATSHIEARREFEALITRFSDTVPAWRIVAPPPLDRLRAAYREGEVATGVPWEILAAINLVETGFGRIQGLSTAGARGPMQFLPSTWEIHGQGGDIDDPGDAIAAAARFLAAHGAPADLDGALYRYNNSDHYVRGVRNYAAVLEEDPAALAGLWSWDVIFRSTAGDLQLAVGYDVPEPVVAAAWLADHPDALVSW